MTDFLPIPAQAPPRAHATGARAGSSALTPKNETAWEVANALEAAFLTEMLKSAGFGEQENSMSGGHGEDHFASFHRQAIAERMVAAGGLGLAEAFYRSMMEARTDA